MESWIQVAEDILWTLTNNCRLYGDTSMSFGLISGFRIDIKHILSIAIL